jgi:uncharacterized protein (DUF2062 family)
MARKFFRRFMPSRETINQHRSLRLFRHWLEDPNLWHLNRYSVSSAVFIGLLIAFVPLPIHIIAVAMIAIWWRANLPISLTVIWLSNPITMPAQFFMAYKVGAFLLEQPPSQLQFELTWHWLSSEFGHIWQPLLLGCLVCGLSVAFLGAGLVRIAWRAQVIARWRARQRCRVRPQ